MIQALPKIIPVNELKNTSQVMKTCQESEVPVVVTKNGYGEMVLMSIKLYEVRKGANGGSFQFCLGRDRRGGETRKR